MKGILLYLAILLLFPSVVCADPDLGITVGNDGTYPTVTLENSVFRAQIRTATGGGPCNANDNPGSPHIGKESAIRDLVIRSVGTDQVSLYLDANAKFGPLLSATEVNTGNPDVKKVRLVFQDCNSNPIGTEDVTIFADSSVIKLDYISYPSWSNQVDLGTPNGNPTFFVGDTSIFGQESFIRSIRYHATDGDPPDYGPKEAYWNTYNVPPNDNGAGDFYVDDPLDAGSLNYNGHVIMAVAHNNIGFGRIMPVKQPGTGGINVIKLLWDKGTESFMNTGSSERPSFTGYLYVFDTGLDNAIDMGKTIVDGLPSSDFSFQAHEFNLENLVGWVRVGDMDNDGYLDIATGTLTLFLNNGNGGWTRVNVIETESNGEPIEDYELLDENGAFLYDIDGDGDLDLLKSKRYQDPGWVENPGDGSARTIAENEQWKWYRLATGFDEGGGPYHKWWDNPPKYGWFNHDLEPYDLDGDGKAEEFVHVFLGAYVDDYYQVHWFKPGANPKDLWERHVIISMEPAFPDHNQAGLSDGGNDAFSYGDMDNDGDIDFAVSTGWAENPGGDATGTWLWHQVAPDGILNGDGKPHISNYIDQGLYMGVSNSLFGDMDMDSDLDIVMSWGHHGYGIHWFENTGDPKTRSSWIEHWVDPDLLCPEGLQLYDMDGDSDLDIVAADLNFGNPPDNIPGEWTDNIHSVYIFENLGGSPLQFQKHIVYTGNPLHSLKLYDINQDGRMDIIGDGQADQTITYLQNTGGSSGCTSDSQCNYLDNLPCVDGYCDSGTCKTQFTTSSCNDGISCTQNDYCSNGACVAGTPNNALCTERPDCTTATCTSTGCEYSGCPALPDTVLWLPLDGNFNDLSGNDNHMSCSSCPSPVPGQKDGAYMFSGTSWLSRPDSDLNGAVPSKNSVSTNDFTVSAWVRLNSLGDRMPIVSKQGGDISGNMRGFVFTATDGSGTNHPNFEVFKDETSSSSVLSTESLSADTWYHLVATYDYVSDGSSMMRIYINGNLDGSIDSAVGPVQGNPQDLDVGRYYYNSGYSRYMDGVIDDLRIYNRALSAQEIQDLCDHNDREFAIELRFDEGYGSQTADSSGNENHGTIYGAAWSNQNRIGSYGLSLDGDDYISIPDNPTLDPQEFTVSAWIRHDSTTQWHAISDKRDTDTDGYSMFINTGSSSLFFRVNSNTITGTTPIDDSEWHHIAGTYDGSTMKVYVDGVEENSVSAGATTIDTSGSLNIGTRYTLQSYFSGEVDDFRIYSRDLSAQEILELYDSYFHTCDDNPRDGCVEEHELILFIDLWKYDSTANPMGEVMEAVTLWSRGTGCVS